MQELILPAYVDAQKAKLPSAQLYVDAAKWLIKGIAKAFQRFFTALFEQSPIDRQIEEMRYKIRMQSHL